MIMEDMLGISGVRIMENMRRRGERKVKGGSIMEHRGYAGEGWLCGRGLGSRNP